MVVRKNGPVTKDRAKALVASGLQRAILSHKDGIEAVAYAAGCTRRCLEKALAHDTLPSLETLLNAMDADPSILDEALAAKGYRVIPNEAALSPDMMTLVEMSQAMTRFCEAMEDGRRDHRETAEIAAKLRPLVPKLCAIIEEADTVKLRSVA